MFQSSTEGQDLPQVDHNDIFLNFDVDLDIFSGHQDNYPIILDLDGDCTNYNRNKKIYQIINRLSLINKERSLYRIDRRGYKIKKKNKNNQTFHKVSFADTVSHGSQPLVRVHYIKSEINYNLKPWHKCPLLKNEINNWNLSDEENTKSEKKDKKILTEVKVALSKMFDKMFN